MDKEKEVRIKYLYNEESDKYGCYLFFKKNKPVEKMIFLNAEKVNIDVAPYEYENIEIIKNEKILLNENSFKGAVLILKMLDESEITQIHNLIIEDLKKKKDLSEILNKLNKQFLKKKIRLFNDYNLDYANLALLFFLVKNKENQTISIENNKIYVFASNYYEKTINISFEKIKNEYEKYVFFYFLDDKGLNIIELADQLLDNQKIKKDMVFFIEKVKKKYQNKKDLPKYSIENTLKDITVELNNVLNNININDDKIKSANFIIQLD